MPNKNIALSPGSYLQFTCLCDILDICSKVETSVFPDYKSLTNVLHLNSDKYMPRDVSQLDCISQFALGIRYIKGSDNIVTYSLVLYNTFCKFWNSQHWPHRRWITQGWHIRQSKRNFFAAERAPSTFYPEITVLWCEYRLLKIIRSAFTAT